jgi:uncharacterized membrane protein
MRSTRCSFSDSVAAGLRNLRDDRRGTIAITAALSATVLFGFAGLAIDVASWQVAQLSMQGTADAAAFSAALALSKNPSLSQTQIQIQAQGIASQPPQGYVDGQNGVIVAVNQPPSTANGCTNPGNTYTGPGAAAAVQVFICQPQARFFSVFFLASNPTVNASAVAADVAGNVQLVE